MIRQLPLPIDRCQRWQEGACIWRPAGERINPREYEAAAIGPTPARAFVATHHYSRSCSSTVQQYGLFRRGALVGVAVLSSPIQAAVLRRPFPGLTAYRQSLELGRFVLLDDVPGNGESWFLGEVFRLAAAAGLRGLVSYSDPVPRVRQDSTILMPGHIGVIYQATNATYLGRSRARTLTLLPDDTVLNERSLAKVWTFARNWRVAVRQLVANGAPELREGDDVADWWREVARHVPLRRLPHPGNHTYVWRLGTRRERRGVVMPLPSLPYPKKAARGNHRDY